MASAPDTPPTSASSRSTAPADFDPHATFYDQKGFEYRNFAAYLCGEPVKCWRNERLRVVWEGASRSLEEKQRAVKELLEFYDSAGFYYANPRHTSRRAY